jgi:hypothetical protein
MICNESRPELLNLGKLRDEPCCVTRRMCALHYPRSRVALSWTVSLSSCELPWCWPQCTTRKVLWYFATSVTTISPQRVQGKVYYLFWRSINNIVSIVSNAYRMEKIELGTKFWKKYNLGDLFANMHGDRYSSKVPLSTWHRPTRVTPV